MMMVNLHDQNDRISLFCLSSSCFCFSFLLPLIALTSRARHSFLTAPIRDTYAQTHGPVNHHLALRIHLLDAACQKCTEVQEEGCSRMLVIEPHADCLSLTGRVIFRIVSSRQAIFSFSLFNVSKRYHWRRDGRETISSITSV